MGLTGSVATGCIGWIYHCKGQLAIKVKHWLLWITNDYKAIITEEYRELVEGWCCYDATDKQIVHQIS